MILFSICGQECISKSQLLMRRGMAISCSNSKIKCRSHGRMRASKLAAGYFTREMWTKIDQRYYWRVPCSSPTATTMRLSPIAYQFYHTSQTSSTLPISMSKASFHSHIRKIKVLNNEMTLAANIERANCQVYRNCTNLMQITKECPKFSTKM